MQATPAISRRRRERWFYLSMSIAAVITVFAGFAPTYYLRPYFNTSPLMPLLHLHGMVFTSWLALFLVQTTLVAAHRTDIHRRLGILGGVIALAIDTSDPELAAQLRKLGASGLSHFVSGNKITFVFDGLGSIS